MTMRKIQIVEVGPRDGFQPIKEFIPTEQKFEFIDRLYAAGVRRMEAGAFVSTSAVPQMADAPEILAHCARYADLDVQMLVPTGRQAERALQAGAGHIAFVMSASPAHNQSNVRRTPEESVEEFALLVSKLPPEIRVRINLATAFDCPFDGPVDQDAVLHILARLTEIAPTAEIALCDTTGRVTPDRVSALFARAISKIPQVGGWAFHGHDTYGLGVANALAAIGEGVTVIDSAFAGLGGCPFAPGATGNVATEDLVWTLDAMEIETGIDLDRLLTASLQAERIPGAATGGRVRNALRAKLTEAV